MNFVEEYRNWWNKSINGRFPGFHSEKRRWKREKFPRGPESHWKNLVSMTRNRQKKKEIKEGKKNNTQQKEKKSYRNSEKNREKSDEVCVWDSNVEYFRTTSQRRIVDATLGTDFLSFSSSFSVPSFVALFSISISYHFSSLIIHFIRPSVVGGAAVAIGIDRY